MKTRKIYTKPELAVIVIDAEISLQMQSAPPSHPWEAPSGLPGIGF